MAKIAYLILAHHLPEQLTRLIHRLATSDTYFFVHVSKSTDDIEYNKMVEGVRDLPNVLFLKRQKTYWGGILFPVVEGIREIFKKKKLEFDYMFLLSGQDYPIKRNIYIANFLSKNNGKQFIHYFPIPRDKLIEQSNGLGKGLVWEDERGGLDRIEYWHIRVFGRTFQIPGDKSSSRLKSFIRFFVVLLAPKRKFVKGFKPFGGSAWWCLTRECLAYIHDFINENPRFVDYFKYVNIPEEIFFQTIILSSPFRDSVVNDDLRCIDWSDGGWHVQPWYRCPFKRGEDLVWRAGPRIWRKEDFENLKNAKALIARKFDSRTDPEILDLIDHNLLSTRGEQTHESAFNPNSPVEG